MQVNPLTPRTTPTPPLKPLLHWITRLALNCLKNTAQHPFLPTALCIAVITLLYNRSQPTTPYYPRLARLHDLDRAGD